jgi:hypothetical protein
MHVTAARGFELQLTNPAGQGEKEKPIDRCIM